MGDAEYSPTRSCPSWSYKIMIKFICDKADCGVEINQQEGGGTFTLITKETILDQQTKQIVPQLKQQEFQICIKHSQEIIDFIRKKVE